MLLFSHSVVSDSLWPHVLQHNSFPCPSLSPGVCSNSLPLSRWCYPNISSSVTLFSSCPQSFPASGSFPMGGLFTLGGQSIGASTSASVLAMSIQSWFPIELTCLISLLSKGLSRVFYITTVWKNQFFSTQPSLWSNSHMYMTTEKHIDLTIWNLVANWCLCFLICCLGLSWLFFQRANTFNFITTVPSTVILEPKKIKCFTILHFVPFYLPWDDGTGCHDLYFLNVEF